jgi:endoglucanase
MYHFFSKAFIYRVIALCTLFMSLMSCSVVPTPTEEPKDNTEPTSLPNPIMFGSYTYGGVWHGIEPIYNLESKLGQKLSVVHWFSNWYNFLDHKSLEIASTDGRIPMISWQPHNRSFDDIINGKYDIYIRSWALSAKDFGKTIYLRPFPEMNGNWTEWNGQPDKLVIAWRHIVELFRQEGADNVLWVWSPNANDEPRTLENRMELYYPGDDYVDILAVDGYNWGNTKSYSLWKDFDSIFESAYDRITALNADKPFWVAEVASAERGGDKAAWINDMFNTTAFPRLEAIIWFDENKETDWRVDSSSDALQAFRTGLSNNLKLASK